MQKFESERRKDIRKGYINDDEINLYLSSISQKKGLVMKDHLLQNIINQKKRIFRQRGIKYSDMDFGYADLYKGTIDHNSFNDMFLEFSKNIKQMMIKQEADTKIGLLIRCHREKA